MRDKEYDAVKRAINKWNFIATSFAIADETNLTLQKVRAVLDLLKKRRLVYTSYKGEGAPVYKTT